MEQTNKEVNPKLRLTLIIILPLFCVAIIAFLFIEIFYWFGLINFSKWIPITLFIGFFLLIVTASFRKKTNPKINCFIIVTSIIWTIFNLVGFPFTILKSINDSNEIEREKIVQQYATIENAIECLEEGFTLHNELTKNVYTEFKDDDNRIKEKFISLDFELVGKGSHFTESLTYLYAEMLTITFADDFSGLVVRSFMEFGRSCYEGINSYSIDQNDGFELKAMIDSKINNQLKYCA